MDPRLITALDRKDVGVAVATIELEDDPARVLAMYHGAVRHLYWANKDLGTAVRVGRAALGFGRTLTDPQLLGVLKPICYDLGSFCWPGWDEPGIEVDKRALELGREATERNAELVAVLDVDALGQASAQWLTGAWRLHDGDLDHAVRAFEACATQAHIAGERGLELLATNYAKIARRDTLDLDAFAELDDGDDLVAQLQTAQRVYG